MPIFPTPKKAAEIEPKAPQFYLQDWLPIPKKAVSMISAPGGTGKSFLSIQIACQMIQENSGRKVLLWLSEDPAGQSRKRLDQVLSRVMIADQDLVKNCLANIEIIGSEEIAPHIHNTSTKDLIEYCRPYNLIIFDPLIAFYPGEENNNSEARRFLNIFNRVAAENGQAIIFVHHHNKGTAEKAGSTRGAGAFVDSVRLVYEMEVIEKSQDRKVKIAKDNWGARMLFGDEKNIKILPFEVKVEGEEKDDKIEGEKKSTFDLL